MDTVIQTASMWTCTARGAVLPDQAKFPGMPGLHMRWQQRMMAAGGKLGIIHRRPGTIGPRATLPEPAP